MNNNQRLTTISSQRLEYVFDDMLSVNGGIIAPHRVVARRLVAGGGRLHPHQRLPFSLVLEFVGPERDATTLLRAYRTLDRQLRDHGPILSRFADGRFLPGAVTVTVAEAPSPSAVRARYTDVSNGRTEATKAPSAGAPSRNRISSDGSAAPANWMRVP